MLLGSGVKGSALPSSENAGRSPPPLGSRRRVRSALVEVTVSAACGTNNRILGASTQGGPHAQRNTQQKLHTRLLSPQISYTTPQCCHYLFQNVHATHPPEVANLRDSFYTGPSREFSPTGTLATLPARAIAHRPRGVDRRECEPRKNANPARGRRSRASDARKTRR